MRVHVVSDVHGNVEALKRVGDGADAVLVLGDLLNFVDYHDHSGGILGAIFGPDKVAAFAALRSGKRNREAVEYVRALWDGLRDSADAVQSAIREQYRDLFGALSAPTYLTPGNVDAPEVWPEFAGAGITVLDDECATLGGLRFGFAGGGLRAADIPPRSGGGWQPYLRSEADLAAGLRALGRVDVLCTHVPPDIPELVYDVVATRAERGSVAARELIDAQAPMAALFGHVHQPLAQRLRRGHTECVNVGHFQRTATPYVLRW
ncbi:MAG: metallophosphoesterase family protein [Sciscionella sp.]